jgi:hypothetical protein
MGRQLTWTEYQELDDLMEICANLFDEVSCIEFQDSVEVDPLMRRIAHLNEIRNGFVSMGPLPPP